VLLYKLFPESSFDFLLHASLGIASTIVGGEWSRKSISVERTFRELSAPQDLKQKLHELAEHLETDLRKEKIKVRT
jgi:DNA polymerase kappa